MRFFAWRYKRFHVSILLAWLGLGLLAGIFLGQFVGAISWWLIAPLLVVSVTALHDRRWYACGLIVLVGVGFGLLRGSSFMHELQQLDGFVGKEVTLSGTISQDPVLKNGSNMWQAQLTNVRVSDRGFSGEVFASIVSDDTLKRGDTVTVFGKGLAGFGSFRLSMFRAELRHVVRPNDVFLAARDTFSAGVRQVMPEPEASLGVGFLVGEKATLPTDLTEQMKTVGLTHIIVASGYNLTILVRFARRLLARRSRYLALAGSLTLVAGFVLVSGFSPSMNRAAVVTFLTLLAWYYGRKFHPIKLILYVAALSALIYPVYVWGNLGWLLSFAAFTGVLVVSPLATRLFYDKAAEPGALMRLVIETLSAEIMTLPIIVAAFGYVPVLALCANVAVAPVIPFAMLFTFIAGIAGLLAPVFAILAAPASIVIAYTVAAVEYLSGPDWSRLPLQLPIWSFALWYLLLLAACAFVWHRRKVDLLEVSVVE